jgi:Calcineurin-like phosphoesterase
VNIQLLSDLHLESEDFDPKPHPEAELLILAGDIDSTWVGYARFARWPVPVIAVAGNHEFDDRELDDAWPALRERCGALGIRLLERESLVLPARDGRRIRFVGTVRWCDFDAFGPTRFQSAFRAGSYFQRVMNSTQGGAPFDAAAVRREALACRAWLAEELPQRGAWDATVAITHFAPSLRSIDPRYGKANGSASFCNADDDLLQHAALWLHGHLHCRHDYVVAHADGRRTRVASQARGLADKREPDGYDAAKLIGLEPGDP